MNFPQNKFVPYLRRWLVYLGVFWIVFLLGRSVWQNWSLKKSITKLNEQIVTLTEQKKELEALNIYYNSDSFKELEARKELNLKKPGEKVVILPATPAPSSSNFPEEVAEEQERVAGATAPTAAPTWLLWWQYFTK